MKNTEKKSNLLDVHLATLDYRSILQIPKSQFKSNLEKYIRARAQIVLQADLEEADFSSLTGSPFLNSLLEAQRGIYRVQHLESALLHLMHQIPLREPYVLGEYYFTLGTLFGRLYRNSESLGFFQQAIGHYEKAQLPAHQALALYNICISAHNLEQKNLFSKAQSQLRLLVKHHPCLVGRLHVAKLEAELAIAKEDYPKAHRQTTIAHRLALQLGRINDSLSALFTEAYLSFKLDHFSRLQEIELEFQSHPTSYYSRAFRDLMCLIHHSFWDTESIQQMIKDLTQRHEGAFPMIYYWDLLLDSLFRNRDYAHLFEVLRQAKRYFLKHQHACHLMDLRPYEVECLIHLRQLPKARKTLHTYMSDAKRQDSLTKAVRADQLQNLLHRELEKELPEASYPKLELNTFQHRLRVDALEISLSRFPILERTLLILSKQKGPIRLDAFFEQIYGHPYSTHRHEPRLKSTIERLRTLLGSPEWIINRDGQIQLMPPISVLIKRPGMSLNSQRSQARLETLKAVINKSTRPISMQTLERKLSLPRRTLQKDLRRLLDTQQVLKRGTFRSTTYEGISK